MKISTYKRNKEVMKLYYKGIEPKVIAQQMNLSLDNTYKIIQIMRKTKKIKIK